MSRAVHTEVVGEVVVIDGPDRGRNCQLGDREVVIGSHVDCDLVLTDDRVSGRHVGIRAHGERFVIRDLGSRNGTWHEGAKITEQTVAAGSTIVIARSTLRVDAAQPTEPTQAPRATSGASVAVYSDLPYTDARAAMLHEFERRYLGEVLVRCKGSLTAAAAATGIERDQLRALIRKHGLLVADDR